MNYGFEIELFAAKGKKIFNATKLIMKATESLQILKDLPYGSLVSHKNKLYFKSEGLNGDILTGTNGRWQFIDHTYCDHRIKRPQTNDYHRSFTKWKSFKIIYSPKKV